VSRSFATLTNSSPGNVFNIRTGDHLTIPTNTMCLTPTSTNITILINGLFPRLKPGVLLPHPVAIYIYIYIYILHTCIYIPSSDAPSEFDIFCTNCDSRVEFCANISFHFEFSKICGKYKFLAGGSILLFLIEFS